MGSFSSRWLDYAPAKEKLTQTPRKGTDKTDKSFKPAPIEAPSISAPVLNADGLARLPWQLERLLSAAAANALEVELPEVPDPQRYTLAWGAAYLTGDRDEALRRLWAVYRKWQGVN
jgi:hypothetical protein